MRRSEKAENPNRLELSQQKELEKDDENSEFDADEEQE